MKAVYKAAAKINLMLDILSRLDNGYHSLFMIMQSVSLFDRVSVEKTTSGGIFISCSEKQIPCDKTNIAYKAAMAFFEAVGQQDYNISINIEKNIPFAAGLAGGSADGAAVIAALNDIYQTHLSLSELCSIGVRVGADVPFCLDGGTRLAQNIGDVLSPLPDLEECFIVLAKPENGVSTSAAYSEFDKRGVRHLDKCAMLYAAVNKDFKSICSLTGNVFEQLIEVPQRVPIKTTLLESNALCVCMSGSGPTVFGLFDNEKNALEAVEKLKLSYKEVFLTKPVKSGLIKEV